MMLMYVRGELEIRRPVRGGYAYRQVVPPKSETGPETDQIVPERPPYVPYPGPFELLAPGLVSTVLLPSQAEMEALEIPEELKQRMFLSYKAKAKEEIVPPAPVIVPYVGEMPPRPMPAAEEMPDAVRNAILHMRCHFPFVTTVFYSLDRGWLFVGDDMQVAEIMYKLTVLDMDLLIEATASLTQTPVVYRLPLEGQS